ncbi:hypothetical protein GCM10007320_09210 [Pseudorhodoferax aquiterrae]|uniref:Uncharacterized protein n=1 Tax=Pseudorhodoferax aquiterrae TaxID=747304 RepID=A0ABQ3FY33_9BURK|nr:hypothetical protein [Pseudorhodoferax aquiterrae]GHC72961.1 hypothetical protein GCM10007320_09210 [Pseudorhodoferax aquiterrae]
MQRDIPHQLDGLAAYLRGTCAALRGLGQNDQIVQAHFEQMERWAAGVDVVRMAAYQEAAALASAPDAVGPARAPDDWRQYATEREETAQAVIERHRRELQTTGGMLAAARTRIAELEAASAPEAEPYGWVYERADGFRMLHKAGDCQEAKLAADRDAAERYPDVHRLTTVYAAPVSDPQAQVVATHPAMEAAARWVEARRDAYVNEHGSYDPDTGGTDFPGDGAEYVQELEEIAESLRALAPLPEPRVDDLAHTVRRLAHSLRQAAPSNDLPGKALDYLKRHGLQGSPLRAAQEQGEQRPEPLPSLARWSQHG